MFGIILGCHIFDNLVDRTLKNKEGWVLVTVRLSLSPFLLPIKVLAGTAINCFDQ